MKYVAIFDFEIIDNGKNPDVLFYSCFLENKQNIFNGTVRIYISGENDFPDLNMCDYSVTHRQFDYSGRNIRIPYFYWHRDSGTGVNPYKELLAGRRMPVKEHSGFCCDVISNSRWADPKRFEMIAALETAGHIAHGGRINNNTGGPVKDKLDFISNYKFCIAAENSVTPGYVTEKIADAFYARTVPVYFGDPSVVCDFNPESFIRASDFNWDFKALAEYVKNLTPEQYGKMLDSNPLPENPADYDQKLREFLANALNAGPARSEYGRIKLLNDLSEYVHKKVYYRL